VEGCGGGAGCWKRDNEGYWEWSEDGREDVCCLTEDDDEEVEDTERAYRRGYGSRFREVFIKVSKLREGEEIVC